MFYTKKAYEYFTFYDFIKGGMLFRKNTLYFLFTVVIKIKKEVNT